MSTSALLAAVLLLAAPEPKVEDQAKQMFDAGRQAYESGLYLAAARAFRDAYALSPKPAILFSEAQAYRLQYAVDDDPGTLKKAVELYQAYLEVEPEGRRRADAVKHLSRLKENLQAIELARGKVQMMEVSKRTELMLTSQTAGAEGAIDGGAFEALPLAIEITPGRHKIAVRAKGHRPATLDVEALEGRLLPLSVGLEEEPAKIGVVAPDGAEVSLDGKPVGAAPFPGPLEIPAGRHLVTVSLPGTYSFVREVSLGRGEALDLEAALPTTAQRYVAYGFFSSGAALAAASAVTAVLSAARQADARQISDKLGDDGTLTDPAEAVRYNDLLDERDRYRTTTVGLLAGAGLTGLIGVLVYILDEPGQVGPPPVLTASGGEVGAGF